MSGNSNPWLRSDRPRGDAYDARFAELAASGKDVHGEAALVASLAAGSVLDAGCGTGRVAVELARRGVEVVGVDIDPQMLAAARAKAPELEFHEADLASFDLGRRFDAVVAAGNVMIFLTPGTEQAVLERLAAHLTPGGALISGFALGRGELDLGRFDRLAEAAGLTLRARYGTWERAPFVAAGADYAVSVHARAGAR